MLDPKAARPTTYRGQLILAQKHPQRWTPQGFATSIVCQDMHQNTTPHRPLHFGINSSVPESPNADYDIMSEWRKKRRGPQASP